MQALARHYSPLYGRELDANTEITVSVGVSEVRGSGRGGTMRWCAYDGSLMTDSTRPHLSIHRGCTPPSTRCWTTGTRPS